MELANILLIFGIVFGVAFLVIITLLVIFLRRLRAKNKVRVVLFTPANGKKVYYRLPDDEGNIEIKDKVYNYVEDCTVKTFWNKEIYYFEGNKDPIKFDHKKHSVDITPANFKKAIKNNLISQIFGDGLLSTANILTIITMLLVIAVLLITLFSGGAVNIGDNEANRALLESVVRKVMTGG